MNWTNAGHCTSTVHSSGSWCYIDRHNNLIIYSEDLQATLYKDWFVTLEEAKNAAELFLLFRAQ